MTLCQAFVASCVLIQHGDIMHHVIASPLLVVAAALLMGCVDPMSPSADRAGAPALVVEAARRPNPWQPPPDSVGIPPWPFPPIYEEVPLELGVPQ